MTALLLHRVTAAFVLLYGSLGGTVALVGQWGHDACRDRYEGLLNDQMCLPGTVGWVRNVDLSHRDLGDIRVFRPDRSDPSAGPGFRVTDLEPARLVPALDAPVLQVEQFVDGSRIFTARKARLDLGDVLWMKHIRWPSNPGHPLRAVVADDCTLVVRQDLPGGRSVGLELGGVDGMVDFHKPPMIVGELTVRTINGVVLAKPARLSGRMRRGPPSLSLEEARLELAEAVPLAPLIAGLTNGAAVPGTVSGHLVVRRPAEDNRVRIGFEGLALKLPGGTIRTESITASSLGVVLGAFSTEADVPAGSRPLKLAGPGGKVTRAPDGGWAGELRYDRCNDVPFPVVVKVDATLPTLRDGADAAVPGVPVVFAAAAASVGPAASSSPADAVAAVPAGPLPALPQKQQPQPPRDARLRLSVDGVPVAPLTDLLVEPWKAVRTGTLRAAVDATVFAAGGFELNVTAGAEGLALDELAAAMEREGPKGRLDLQLKRLRVRNLWAEDAILSADAEWLRPDGKVAGRAGGSVDVTFDWPGWRVLWKTRGLAVTAWPWEGPLELDGTAGFPSRGEVPVTARLLRAGTVRFDPVPTARAVVGLDLPTTVSDAALEAKGVPVRELGRSFGLDLPAGKVDVSVGNGAWTAGGLPSFEGKLTATFGTAAEPGGKVVAGLVFPDGAATLQAEGLLLAGFADVAGVPGLAGKLEAKLADGRLRAGALHAGTVTISGKVDDLRPVCKAAGAPEFHGFLRIDRATAVVADGAVESLSVRGTARDLYVSELAKAAGLGNITGRVDVVVHEATMKAGRTTALKVELSESPGYGGSRTVSKEALKQIIELANLPSSLAFTALDYDCLGAVIEKRGDKLVVEGTQTTSTATVARLKVFIPAPVYLPESIRVRDAGELADLEAQVWKAVRSVPLRVLP